MYIDVVFLFLSFEIPWVPLVSGTWVAMWLISFTSDYKPTKNLKISKGVIKSRKSKKDRQSNSQKKKRKRQAMICNTLHRKLEIMQQKPNKTKGELRCSGIISSSCSNSGTLTTLPWVSVSILTTGVMVSRH